MSSYDRESLRNSESIKFPIKSESGDSSSLSADKLKNNDFPNNVGVYDDDSLFMDPDMEFKAEPEIFESSDDNMKYSYDCDVSASEDLQRCQKEANKEDESVNTSLWTEIGLKEECGKGEAYEEENQIKEEKIDNSDCDTYLFQKDDPKIDTAVGMRENDGKQSSEIANLNTRMLIDAGSQFTCRDCGEIFSEQNDLIVHYRIHTPKKPFKCNVCNKAFSDRSNLTKHYRIHTGEKPFKCNVCNEAFSQKVHLIKHYRIHTGEKPFRCNVCNKAFSHRANLTSHSRIHTGEKPFRCNVCNIAFSHRGNFTSHYRSHNREKPFKCNVCNIAFSHRRNLVKHYRIHTGEKPFKCSVCNKAFSQRGHLTKHYRIHTGEKPFKCNVCDKSFSQKNNLTNHYRIHTGEKSFKCNVCDKAFSRKSNLIRHYSIHTTGGEEEDSKKNWKKVT